MTRDEFIQRMVEKGKLTKEQLDKIVAKDAAKEKFKKDKDRMNKAELIAMLDMLVK